MTFLFTIFPRRITPRGAFLLGIVGTASLEVAAIACRHSPLAIWILTALATAGYAWTYWRLPVLQKQVMSDGSVK